MAQPSCRITLRQLVDDYLALQCTRPVTQTSTRYHLAGLLALYGGWQARRLTPQHIMDYLDAQRRSGVSPRTSTHRAKLLRTALQWGVTSGRLAANPLSGLRLPTARPRRMDPPTTVEARRMAQVAAPHVLRVIVLGMLQALRRRKLRMKTVIGYTEFRPKKLLSPSVAMLSCSVTRLCRERLKQAAKAATAGAAAGPRIGPSELFRLRWEDVDLDAAIIRMPNAHKGAREESRVVPIRDDILPLLRQWTEQDAALGCPWVIHWRGRQVRCIGHAWHTARRAAGITRRITPYSLRHAMPTEALEHGADVKAVAEVAPAVAALAACLSRSRQSRVTEQDSIATDGDSDFLGQDSAWAIAVFIRSFLRRNG